MDSMSCSDKISCICSRNKLVRDIIECLAKYDEPIPIISLKNEIRPNAKMNIFNSTISIYCSKELNTDIKLWERRNGLIVIENYVREIIKK